jgi:hypothetical protein
LKGAGPTVSDVRMCVCERERVCVCVWERERERGREVVNSKGWRIKLQMKGAGPTASAVRLCMCVSVHVWVCICVTRVYTCIHAYIHTYVLTLIYVHEFTRTLFARAMIRIRLRLWTKVGLKSRLRLMLIFGRKGGSDSDFKRHSNSSNILTIHVFAQPYSRKFDGRAVLRYEEHVCVYVCLPVCLFFCVCVFVCIWSPCCN